MFPISDFESIKAEMVSDTRVSKPRLSRWRSQGPGEPYYQFELQSQVKDYRTFSKMDAQLDSYQGELEVFQLNNPIISHKAHNGLYLYQSANKGVKQIVVAGFVANQSDAVAAGDFIQLAGSSKGYRIREDANANASGRCTINLTQGLIQSHASTEAVAYGEDVVFQVCMTDRDSDSTEASKNKWGSHYVELIEQQ